MADIVFGILIKGKDLAGQAFGSAAKGAKGLASSVKSTAATIASTAKGIVGNLANIDAGFRIAGKGARLLTQGITSLVNAALESRAANDQQRKDWEAYAKVAKEIMTLVGGPLLTAFLGLFDAIKPIIFATRDWLKENQRLIASGLLDFLLKTAQVLTNGIAKAIIYVSRIWNGWRELIGAVQIAVNSMFAGILSGASAVVGAVGAVAARFGKDGLAASALEAQAAIDGLGATFEESSDRALAETAAIVKSQDDLEAKVNDVANTITAMIAGRSVVAFKQLDAEIRTANGSLAAFEKRMAALRALKDITKGMRAEEETALDEADKRRSLRLERELTEYRDAEAVKLELAKATADEQKALAQEAGDALGDAFMTAYSVAREAFAGIGDTIDGKTKSWEMALGQFAERTAAIILEKLLISGVLKVLSLIGGALIGGGLGAIGVTAGTDAFSAPFNKGGIVGHNRGGIAGYAGGGVVAGAIGANRDTEIIAATTGEGILTRRTTEMVARDLGGGAGGGSRSTPPPIAHAAPSSGIVVAPMFGSPNRTDLDRVQMNVLRPSQARLERRRAWGLNSLPTGR